MKFRNMNSGKVYREATQPINKIKQGVSFADMVRGDKKEQGNIRGVGNIRPVNKIREMLDSIAFENFGCDYREVETKFMSFMNDYEACTDDTDRSLAFLDFIYTLRFNA